MSVTVLPAGAGLRPRIHDAGLGPALLAVWLLGERAGRQSASASSWFGLIGVVVILRPGLAAFNRRPGSYSSPRSALPSPGHDQDADRDQSTFSILLWMMIIQFPMSLIGSNPAVFLDPKLYDLSHILPAIGGRHFRLDLALVSEQCISAPVTPPGWCHSISCAFR